MTDQREKYGIRSSIGSVSSVQDDEQYSNQSDDFEVSEVLVRNIAREVLKHIKN